MNNRGMIAVLFFFVMIFVSLPANAVVNDADRDFMPDGWESLYGLDMNDSADAEDDPDFDSYTNLEEYGAGTSPLYHLSNPGNFTAETLTLRARALLMNRELIPANAVLKISLETDPLNEEANFYFAVTRLVSLFEVDRDGPDPGRIDSIKELFDSLGMESDGRTVYGWTANYQRDIYGSVILPDVIISGSELQDILLTDVMPEIDGALENLSRIVSSGFEVILTPDMLGADGTSIGVILNTEIDYGDIAMFRAFLLATKTWFHFAIAYNIDFDLPAFVDILGGITTGNINEIFDTYPDFLKLSDATDIGEAKSALSLAIDAYFEASEFIRNETDLQIDDFITIDPIDLPGEADLRLTFADIQQSLSQATDIRPDKPGSRDPTGDYITLDLTRFFDTPISVRNYIPEFVANRPCYVTDPTINNMLPNFSQEDWSSMLNDMSGMTVFSSHWSDGYYASIFFEDSEGLAQSVTATGPGIIGAMNLEYVAGDSFNPAEWWHTYSPFLDTNVPATPQTYEITVTDDYGPCTFQRTITGYVEEFATNLAPEGDTAGSFSFLWTRIPDGESYSVELYDSNDNSIWNYDAYWNNVYYSGLPLTIGDTYYYSIVSERRVDGVGNYSFADGSFTYTATPPPTGSISGTVWAEDTLNVIPNIYVSAQRYQDWNWGGSVRTDSNGNYTISNLPPGYYRIQVSGNGTYTGEIYQNVYDWNAATAVEVYPGANTGSINLSLSRGCSISGSVISDDLNQPIYNIQVNANGNFSGGWGSARTDVSGNYVISGLNPGEYRIQAYGNGTYFGEYYDNATGWNSATLVTVTAQCDPVVTNFSLARAGSISGRVLAAGSNLPIANVQVNVSGDNTYYWNSDWTDASGYYSIGGLSGDDYTVCVNSGSGYIGECYYTPVTVLTGSDINGIDFSLTGSLSFTKVRSFTETFANHPGSRSDGWYLHLSADVSDLSGVPGNIQYVRSVNSNTGIDPNIYDLNYSSGNTYKLHSGYTSQRGTYRFTVSNYQGQSDELNASPINQPRQMDIIQNLSASNNTTSPMFSFDPVQYADKYRMAVFDASNSRIYQSAQSDTPSFNVPSGIMTPGLAYYLRAEALDINMSDGDGVDDLENVSLNYMQFIPTTIDHISGSRSLPVNAAPGTHIPVRITIGIDENNAPNVLTVNETLPSGWEIVDTSHEPGNCTPNNTAFPCTGVVSWLFFDNNGVPDTIISYTIKVPNSAADGSVMSFSGELRYIDMSGSEVSEAITGDQATTINATYHPYDADQNGAIGDFELLDAIDAWADGLLGDFPLLNLIDFWAVGCYHRDNVADKFVSGC